MDWVPANGGETGLIGGGFFEDMVSEIMCGTIGNFMPDALRLFPSLAVDDGRALTDGIGCGERDPHPKTGRDRADVPVPTEFVTRRPDYLNTTGLPTQQDLTLFLGDIKLTSKKLLDDYTGSNPNNLEQFQAIVNHSANYGLRVSVFFTITPFSDKQRSTLNELAGETAVKNGAVAFIVSIL